jgi:riboflavin biosynthesis pyrimidine reductase
LKADSARDISIGGPALAAQAIADGLVDEISLFLHPIVIGAGKPALPTGSQIRLQLLDERHFRSGVVYLRYDVLDTR